MIIDLTDNELKLVKNCIGFAKGNSVMDWSLLDSLYNKLNNIQPMVLQPQQIFPGDGPELKRQTQPQKPTKRNPKYLSLEELQKLTPQRRKALWKAIKAELENILITTMTLCQNNCMKEIKS